MVPVGPLEATGVLAPHWHLAGLKEQPCFQHPLRRGLGLAPARSAESNEDRRGWDCGACAWLLPTLTLAVLASQRRSLMNDELRRAGVSSKENLEVVTKLKDKG